MMKEAKVVMTNGKRKFGKQVRNDNHIVLDYAMNHKNLEANRIIYEKKKEESQKSRSMSSKHSSRGFMDFIQHKVENKLPFNDEESNESKEKDTFTRRFNKDIDAALSPKGSTMKRQTSFKVFDFDPTPQTNNNHAR